MEKIFVFAFVIVLAFCSGGCKSTPVAGDESLVESRILVAVNAERNRWLAEFSIDLGNRMAEGLREVDERVNAVEGGLQQVAVAAKEYRQFVLGIIDGLYQPESQIQNYDGVASTAGDNTGGVDNPENNPGDSGTEISNTR